MKITPHPGGIREVVFQVADRTPMEKTQISGILIAENEQNKEAKSHGAALAEHAAWLLDFYPDTRRGKKDDPQKTLTGMEEGDAAEGKKKS